MTRDEAIQLVCNRWAGVQDAFGLVEALSALGVLKLDEPNKAAKICIAEAEKYTGPSVFVEISGEEVGRMANLIHRMQIELKTLLALK